MIRGVNQVVLRPHREMTERGVSFVTSPSKQFFGWWSVFEDSEGTRYALGQQWGTTGDSAR
jgi:lactoylglutathione lyase